MQCNYAVNEYVNHNKETQVQPMETKIMAEMTTETNTKKTKMSISVSMTYLLVALLPKGY